MEKIKRYRILIFVSILIFGGLLFWYQHKISKVRRDCAESARLGRGLESTSDFIARKENAYNECLRRYGMEK